MKSFAEIKRRIQVGTRLLCVVNTYRPELTGKHRVVTKAQTNGFWWSDDAERNSHTHYPAARDVKIVDQNTFDFPLFDQHYVRLQFAD